MSQVEKTIKEYDNEKVSLRKPSIPKMEEYAEKMLAGVAFPAVVTGEWPKDEKYGDKGTVDGVHRCGAWLIATERYNKAQELGNKEGYKKPHPLEFQHKKFGTLTEALYYMYQANMEHGLPVSEGSRNERIRLLKKIDPKMEWQKIAGLFKISKASVFRILGDPETGEKPGRKTGTKVPKTKAHQTLEPLKPSAFFKSIERINETLTRKRGGMADVVKDLTPMSKKGIKVDVERVEAITDCIGHLETLLKNVEEAEKE